jgi:hypothetical protein
VEFNRRRGPTDDRAHDKLVELVHRPRSSLAERADDHVAAQFSALIAHDA